MVNMTCPIIPDKPEDPKPLFQDGQIHFKAHDVGWLVCGIMALIATISSFWLTWKHLTYYTCPQQQRHIVRLLVMVPIYAIVSFMSYLFYKEALYYQTIRDCYEAVLVTSFFYLILSYTGDTRAEQHAVFRNLKVRDHFWVWPLGSWKYKPEGLHFLWLMKISVLQYAIVRPLCTFIAVGTEYFGYYCLHSWMPWFTHVWCALFISVSVTVAMYCLIQLYVPVRKLVDPYKPILKFLSIKTIVFLTFWQDTFLSFLVSFNVIKDTEYFTGEQIQAGINALLQCFWMMLFGFIHIKAFSYLPYRPEDRSRTTMRGRAMLDAMDFRDWFFEMKESTRYMAARSKGRDYTLAEDLRAHRHQHLLNALGTQRGVGLDAQFDIEKAALPSFWKHAQDAQPYSPSGDASDSDAKASWEAKQRSSDSYTPLPHQSGRARHAGKKVGASQNRPSRKDSHTARAAELQRLVEELDLLDANTSLHPAVIGDEIGYDFQDETCERSALIQGGSSQGQRMESPKNDDHPELTQYHVPTVQLANVPLLTYEREGSVGTDRRHRELSAFVEDDDEQHHTGQASRVAPGGVAFGIADWFGRGSGANPAAAPSHEERTMHLSPGSAPTARHHQGASSGAEADGTGWWRNYWNSVSNPGSREPSVHVNQDELEPPARPAVIRHVTAGSWGGRGLAKPSQQPALRIDTQSHQPAAVERQTEASTDSSRISPHANSPLSRLIQTSRDSLGEVDATSSNNNKAWRGEQQASAWPMAYETRKMAEEIMSNVDGHGGKHTIKFADALIGDVGAGGEEAMMVDVPSGASKVLAPAVGPKGKLVKLVLPSPLSPARYPYGQEGSVSKPLPQLELQAQAMAPAVSSLPNADVGGGGTIKFLAQAKPVKRESEPPRSGAMEPKGIITVGNMSLAQTRARALPDHRFNNNTCHKHSGAKLNLPAPSRLASLEAEDPYRTSSNMAALSRGASTTQSAPTTTSSTNATAKAGFQVGSIVPASAYARPHHQPPSPSPPHPQPRLQQHTQSRDAHPNPAAPRPRRDPRASQFHFEYYRGD